MTWRESTRGITGRGMKKKIRVPLCLLLATILLSTNKALNQQFLFIFFNLRSPFLIILPKVIRVFLKLTNGKFFLSNSVSFKVKGGLGRIELKQINRFICICESSFHPRRSSQRVLPELHYAFRRLTGGGFSHRTSFPIRSQTGCCDNYRTSTIR